MKILLDHNLPFKLRASLAALSNFEFVTASYMGWRELRNGDLLLAAEQNDFDIFVTGDQSLIYEQNLSQRRLAVVILTAQNWLILRNHTAKIAEALSRATPGSCQTVECGTFSRKNPRAD